VSSTVILHGTPINEVIFEKNYLLLLFILLLLVFIFILRIVVVIIIIIFRVIRINSSSIRRSFICRRCTARYLQRERDREWESEMREEGGGMKERESARVSACVRVCMCVREGDK